MSYAEAIRFLYGLRLFGLKLGLDNTRRLAALAGNPHQTLRFIHVAGTNGKGSVCAMLESIYRAAGLRVGLFTSPHLVAFSERIQVDRRRIREADVVRLVGEMSGWLESGWSQAGTMRSRGGVTGATGRNLKVAATKGKAVSHPTFFEVVTMMALRYFAEQECELVIWETGMGGRLDATNIVTPLASVITNVQFDHQPWLGNTLAEIAREKAGIIKPRVPVLTAADAPEALEVIERTARRLHARLKTVTPAEARSGLAGKLALPLPGDHQRLNAALALATVHALKHEIPVREAALRIGLEQVEWPGRLQVVRRGAQTILLDGAHNLAGTETLRSAMEKIFPAARPALVLGVLRDKDWDAMCRVLAPQADRIYVTRVPSERTAWPAELRAACERANPVAKIMECTRLEDALKHAATESFVVVTGSLYLVGEALELLQLSPAPQREERALNEWAPEGKSVPTGLPGCGRQSRDR